MPRHKGHFGRRPGPLRSCPPRRSSGPLILLTLAADPRPTKIRAAQLLGLKPQHVWRKENP